MGHAHEDRIATEFVRHVVFLWLHTPSLWAMAWFGAVRAIVHEVGAYKIFIPCLMRMTSSGRFHEA